jgi:hypothetical protein
MDFLKRLTTAPAIEALPKVLCQQVSCCGFFGVCVRVRTSETKTEGGPPRVFGNLKPLKSEDPRLRIMLKTISKKTGDILRAPEDAQAIRVNSSTK